MTTTIDAAGRIVIPKAIRDAAGFTPGAELNVELDDRDNVVVSVPYMRGHVEKRDGIAVFVPDEPVPPMSGEEVDALIERIRSERGLVDAPALQPGIARRPRRKAASPGALREGLKPLCSRERQHLKTVPGFIQHFPSVRRAQPPVGR